MKFRNRLTNTRCNFGPWSWHLMWLRMDVSHRKYLSQLTLSNRTALFKFIHSICDFSVSAWKNICRQLQRIINSNQICIRCLSWSVNSKYMTLTKLSLHSLLLHGHTLLGWLLITGFSLLPAMISPMTAFIAEAFVNFFKIMEFSLQ